MRILPNVIVSTVGTSLLGHLKGKDESARAIWEKAFQARDWDQVVAGMASSDAPSCGAEINSLHELLFDDKYVISDADLHFCVSDTQDGEVVGEILMAYYKRRNHTGRIFCHTIKELQDTDPDKFSRIGLRNLVIKIAEIVRSAGSSEFVALNATGGYKAQIALAALIGQALGVTVYYKHERFSTIVALPPMPIELDFTLLGENATLLDALEVDHVIPIEGVPDKILPLLNEELIEGKIYGELSAIGQIYLESYRLRYPPEKTLPSNANPDQRKAPTFGKGHHYPEAFKQFVMKIWNENPYIIFCHSESYSGQRGIRDRIFELREGKIIGTYKPDDFGARFEIITTTDKLIQKIAVVEQLTRVYGRG